MKGQIAERAKTIWFGLAPSIWATKCPNSIILLDLARDKYFSLIEESADALTKICSEPFLVDGPCSQEGDIQRWIDDFLEKGYIEISQTEERRPIGNLPTKPGGLVHYQWDTKKSWSPLKSASKFETLRALFYLRKVHRFLANHQLKEALDLLNQFASAKTAQTPSPNSIEHLAEAVDAASQLYPQKSYCLAWALTFALLAAKKNWNVDFRIGVQSIPFYAHAWVEIEGKVIHDDPSVRDVLSIIYRGPNR